VGLILLCGGVSLFWYFQTPKKATVEEVARNQERMKDTIPIKEKKADLPKQDEGAAHAIKPRAQETDDAPPGDGSLPREVLERVKNATVYIRVTGNDNVRSSGSGFFEESSHKVITNAHVIGMLKPGALPPRLVEVVRNSGRPDEITYRASIVAVDRKSDLAVLMVPLSPEEDAELVTLKVMPARNLVETQRVYVFGYPFGEQLHKNVTVSPSAVSSLIPYPDGQLRRVQVNGGMHPGNSGGPVVDIHGNVVGIAVSGVENTQINFAIPGEHVGPILNRR
jgi:S1-C subfamily serine protease